MTEIGQLSALVIGFGSIGNRHVQNLLALGIETITVLRRRSSNSHFSVPQQCGVVHDLGDAIANKPDFAIICTPSSQHVEVAAELLESGIPVLIEKPLHQTIDEHVIRLTELSQSSRAGQSSAMAYCMRYHKAYAAAVTELASGRIGRCLYGKSWFEGYLPDWHPWEDYRTSYAAREDLAGGALRTLDHEIDFMNWALGPATQACGVRSKVHGIGIEADEIAHVISTHPSDVTSQVTLALCRKPASRGFEFVGTEGVLRFDHTSNNLCYIRPDNEQENLLQSGAAEIAEMYVNLLEDFVNQVAGNSSVSTRLAPITAGVDSLRVIDCITAS